MEWRLRIIGFCMVFVLTIGLGPFFGSSNAAAMTDDEYRALLQRSSAFRNADRDLNVIWKGLMKQLDPAARKKLLADQVIWAKQRRDPAAHQLVKKENISLGEAYARITRLRIAELERRLHSAKDDISGMYDDGGMSRLTVRRKNGTIRFTLTTNWPPQHCSGEIKNQTAILSGRVAVFADKNCPKIKFTFTGREVTVEEEGFCGYHGLNCRFDGTYKRVK